MTDTFSLLSAVSFLLAGVLGMTALVFWLQFHIPAIVGELNNRAARRVDRRMPEDREVSTEDVTEALDNIMIIHTEEVIGEGGMERI